MKIAIGLPAFNEEKNIERIFYQIKNMADEIIICDDGSTDNTREIIKKLNVNAVLHEKNLGYGSSINSIFKKARELDIDVLVTFDADGQHRSEDIEKVIKPIIDENYDIVIGSRFLEKDNHEIPKYRKLGIKTITTLSNVSSKQKITDSQSGFRAYNKNAINSIMLTESGMGVSTEILIKANKYGLKINEVPIKVLYDGDTSTQNPATHGVSVMMSTLKFISLEHPLKFYGIPGLMCLIVGLFFIGWTITEYLSLESFPISLALIGVGGIVIGTILLVTAILLFSIVNLLSNRK